MGGAAISLAVLAPRLPALAAGIWGPESPWTHFDFLGGWWLWWAAARPGSELLLQCAPTGILPLKHHFPNPFDAWVFGPLAFAAGPAGARPWLVWNLVQLGHHVANVASAALLTRALGGRPTGALAAAALVAASPVMLHEIAGGRTLPGAVWPGLLALWALRRGAPGWAGLLVGLQGLFYLYTGLLFGVLAAVLLPKPRPSAAGVLRLLLAVVIVWVPYLVWLAPVAAALQPSPPPAGHTALPLAGLVGLPGVPERFRLHPLLLAAGALGLLRLRSSALVAAVAVAGLVAVGPLPSLALDGPLFVSPVAWVQWAVPGLSRMHHPVRAALVLAPLLAAAWGAARWGERARWVVLGGSLVLALGNARTTQLAPTWGAPATPPGAEAARYVAAHATAVVDLTGAGDAALGLQPLHGLPMLEAVRRASPKSPCGALRRRVDGWLAGTRQPGLREDLVAAGYSHLLAIPRREPLPPAVTAALEADLGSPVAPGVYMLVR